MPTASPAHEQFLQKSDDFQSDHQSQPFTVQSPYMYMARHAVADSGSVPDGYMKAERSAQSSVGPFATDREVHDGAFGQINGLATPFEGGGVFDDIGLPIFAQPHQDFSGLPAESHIFDNNWGLTQGISLGSEHLVGNGGSSVYSPIFESYHASQTLPHESSHLFEPEYLTDTAEPMNIFGPSYAGGQAGSAVLRSASQSSASCDLSTASSCSNTSASRPLSGSENGWYASGSPRGYQEFLPLVPPQRSFNTATSPTRSNSSSIPPMGPTNRSAPAVRRRRVGASSMIGSDPLQNVKLSMKGPGRKRNVPLLTGTRMKANELRKVGNCIQCRWKKCSCDVELPCQSCIKAQRTPRVPQAPCTRINFSEHLDYTRICNGRFHQRKAHYLDYPWKSGNREFMEMEWFLPDSTPIPGSQFIKITLREYTHNNPADVDTRTYTWQSDGKVHDLPSPCYASDDSNLEMKFEKFLSCHQNQVFMEDWFQAGLDSRLESSERPMEASLERLCHLESVTYRHARRFRNRSTLLQMAFRIHCGAIMSQGYGSNRHGTLETSHDYSKSGRCSYGAYDFKRGRDRPIPQAVGHQCDVAILSINNRIASELLKKLSRVYSNGGRKETRNYHELFLTFFVLLSNLSYMHSGAKGYIASKMRTNIEERVRDVVSAQIEKWERTVQITLHLLKIALHGYFTQKGMAGIRRHGTDQETIDYMNDILLEDDSEFYFHLSNDESQVARDSTHWMAKFFMNAYGC